MEKFNDLQEVADRLRMTLANVTQGQNNLLWWDDIEKINDCIEFLETINETLNRCEH